MRWPRVGGGTGHAALGALLREAQVPLFSPFSVQGTAGAVAFGSSESCCSPQAPS